MPRRVTPARANSSQPTTVPSRQEPATSVGIADNVQVNVGRRLRELRAEHGLSIRALAEQSQLNVNTLSLIENDKTSPSVSTLQQIAAALKVPIVAFFETNLPKNSVAHILAEHRPQAAFAHGLLEDLGAGLTRRGLEPFVITLDPGADSGSHPIVHTGFEFVFCLQGQIAYSVEERTYVLEPGDSLLFESHLPHQWRNPTDRPSQAILVLSPTDTGDQPAERHFNVNEPKSKA